MITVLALIIILGLLVFVHELGHYIAARVFGVEVRTFAFGFPPRIWSKKVGNTTYAVNALPLGGYVSLRGEDEFDLMNEIAEDLGENTTQKDYDKALAAARAKEHTNEGSLLAKKPWQLVTIFISGVVMNILLAFVLIYLCFVVGFQPIYSGMWEHPGLKNDLRAVVTDVEKNTPAETEGIKPGDVIKTVDGKPYYTSNDILTVIRAKNTDAGAKVTLGILRDGQIVDKTLATYKAKVATSGGKEVEVSRTGIVLKTSGVVRGDLFSSAGAAATEVVRATKLTLSGVADLFGLLVTKFKLSDNVTGPVGIVVATNYFANMGVVYLLQFAFILSISLAVFNVLPIPGLDGGHIAIVLAEAITKRRFTTKTKNMIQLIGFGALILLMIAVSVKDFINFDIIGYIKGIF